MTIRGSQHRVQRNLMSLIVWTGAYQDRFESGNFRWEAGVDALEATSLELEDNVVAGSERAAFRLHGESCGAQPKWRGNVAHGVIIGLLVDAQNKVVT